MKKSLSVLIFKKFQHLILLCLALFAIGCAASTPKQSITTLYSPMYNPNYSYSPNSDKKGAANYTIGIIDMEFTTEATPPNSWVIATPLEKQYVNNFKKSFSGGLEKIFLSKGFTVSGPFESYEEMTYPDRSRCDFLVQPIIKLSFQPSNMSVQRLSGYNGPNGQNWVYGENDFNLAVSAELSYLIYDPLTKEKLERHKLKTDPFIKSSKRLWISMVNRDKNGKITKEWWERPSTQNHPNYHNDEILTGLVTDELYDNFMSKVDKLVSVEEFNHLRKYKKELEKRKRY